MSRERVTIVLPRGEGSPAAAIVERARHRGFRSFVAPPAPELSFDPEEEVLRREGDHLLRPGAELAPVPVVPIATPSELERAVHAAPSGGVLAIEWTGDRVIPLENAVAARGRAFELWAYARSASEVPAALGALEHGADRVLVEVSDPADVDALEAVVEGPLPTGLEWREALLTARRPVGVGDRVLVDTTSVLSPSEGLLVGSAAAFLFHVASEAEGSQFSRPRPFRVNAGAAHSYVLMADGSTRYLSELVAGDAVLVVEPRGSARSVRVGRIKIERRPLDLLVVKEEGREWTLFLQEAETVRVTTLSGRTATTDLVPGTRLLGARLPAARHLGRAVEERIEER